MNVDQPLLEIALPALGIGLAVVCLLFALRAGKRQRLVDNLPTSKTTGVFIGLVELKGTAEAEQPLVSYLAGVRCVQYAWNVQESWSRTVTETYTDANGKTQTRTRTESGWTTVGEGGEEIPCYLLDDCGAIRLQPEGAKLEPQTLLSETCGPGDALYYGKGPDGAVADSDYRRRFVEHGIPLHAPLYVVGQAREREDIVAAEVAADKGAPLFLISTRSEEQVSRGFRAGFWLLGLLGLVLAPGALALRDGVLGRDLASEAALFAGVGSAFLFVWLLGWVWMVFNSLVDLRQRARQGWANVDVQLKRRADLIPNLVAIVTGLRDHERTVQTEVAQMRAQLQATPPGEPGPDPAGCVSSLKAIAEAYPELTANGTFLRLQQDLIETEQRIALARSYFNEIATFYNTRLEVVPDRFIAALGGMRPQPLLSAADFERAPVVVQFAA